MIWPRVQVSFGPNRPAETPLVMPFAAAQDTAFAYQAPPGTSLNALDTVTLGLPRYRHRSVTASARVQVLFGAKLVFVTPEAMPRLCAQSTAL